MKIYRQNSPDLEKIGRLIEGIHIAILTTLDAEGRLASRPMSVLKMDENGLFWFFADANSGIVRQLDRVNLSFSDEDASTYVSIAGHGEVSGNRALVHELWTPLMKPWFPEGEDASNLALLRVEPQVAEYWDSGHSKMVRAFALAASVMASKPIGMGEHGTINLPMSR
jgi:general stress protein 26